MVPLTGGVSCAEGVGCEVGGYKKEGGGGTSCDQGKSLILLEFVVGVFESVVSFVHIIMYIARRLHLSQWGGRGAVGGQFVAPTIIGGTL